MARKIETVVTLIDDLDGSTAESTITFGFEGLAYEIDLSRKNAKTFSDLIAPYVSAARKAPRTNTPGRRSPVAAGTSGSRDPAQLKAIRAWARDNGWPELGNRGRIAADIETAYNNAH